MDVLAEHDGLGSAAIAAELGMTQSQVRTELLELERLGLVLRQKSAGAVTWHIG